MSTVKLSDRLAVILCDRSKRSPRVGICCQNLVILNDITPGIIAWLASVGKIASGNYPIGSGVVEYNQHKAAGTMWRGEYGNERKALLRFLIRFYRERGQ